jgi:hypothetical protein
MGQLIVIIVIAAKYILPLVILKYPFAASLTNFILDSIDGDVLMHFGMPFATYAIVDKAADWVTYLAMFWVGRKWEIGRTITFLFIYRTIGQFAYFATGNDLLLFIFPNFLEPLFIIYSFLLFKDKKKAYARYKKYILPIWVGIIIFKMWNEYNVHLGHRDLSSIYFGVSN